MYYVGVDLGGSHMACGIVDQHGKILYQEEAPNRVPRPYQETLKDMADLIERTVKNGGYSMDQIASIGLGSPGACDDQAGVAVFVTNFLWRDVPVRAELQKYIDKPVHLNNDANVAALAECVAGSCKGARNAILLTLGTGLGGGIVINGRIYEGSHGVAAELGHMVFVHGGVQCSCGIKGCLEKYVAASALVRIGREAVQDKPEGMIWEQCGGDIEKIDGKLIIDCARAGDPLATQVFDQYVEYLAFGIISYLNIFDPDLIALGGGLSRAGDFLLDAVNNKIEQEFYSRHRNINYGKVVLATMGNDAGIIGAAMFGRLSVEGKGIND